MRSPLLLLLSGFLLITACTEDAPHKNITDLIGQVDRVRLRAHITALTDIGPRPAKNRLATSRAADYIKAQLLAFGYQPIAEGPTAVQNHSATGFMNIIAEHPGSAAAASVLELGAHYDTIATSPGADDNASGVAAVLEIARILSQATLHPTVRFCFFAREEDDMSGSRYHVQQLVKSNAPLDGAIILEMIGYATQEAETQGTPARIPWLFSPPTTGDFVAVVGNLRSGGLGNRFERAKAIYVPDLPLFSANRIGGFFRDALRSDHKPYWDHGYNAIMLTDTADFRNPHYHQPTDTLDTLDFGFLQRITQATAATLLATGR